jgi:F-type H+-transporting ATPase subunit delta
MFALRLLSTASRRPAVLRTFQPRRGYAVAANTIKLSLVLPHQSLYTSADVSQVNLPAATGDMGVLAHHEPTLEALRPGVVEVIESNGTSKKWFISGGFATVHPGNSLTVNAVEGAPLEDFSIEAVRANLAEATRAINGTGSDKDKMEARIEAQVYEALQTALK